jgi:hypothetical protein
MRSAAALVKALSSGWATTRSARKEGLFRFSRACQHEHKGGFYCTQADESVRHAQYVRRAIALSDDGPSAAKARRDATHRAIAVARSSPHAENSKCGAGNLLRGTLSGPFASAHIHKSSLLSTLPLGPLIP